MGAEGRALLTITGFVVGSFFGQPGLGAFVGSQVGNALFPAEREKFQGPRLDDLKIQISSYGAPIPVLYGTMRLAGNVIWAAPITEVATDTEEGGKGGVILTDYRYFGTFAIAICAGPVEQILKIWADTKLYYSSTYSNESQGPVIGGPISPHIPRRQIRRSGALQNIHMYMGSESQEPDIWIESQEGVGNVPGHRGMCYVVFKNFALAEFGNRIPNFTFEVSTNTEGVVPYAELKNIQDVGSSNNIVFSPDDISITIEKNGKFKRISITTDKLIFESEFDDIPDGSDFDIDQNDHLYTTKISDESGKSVVTRLSQGLVESGLFSKPVDSPYRIRVSKTNSSSWIIAIPDGGATLEVNTKTNFGDDVNWISIDAVGGLHFVDATIEEETGIIWAVLKHWTDLADWTYLARIDIDNRNNVTIDSWDISSDIERGDYILHDSDTDQILVFSTYDNKVVFYDNDPPTMTKLGEIDVVLDNIKSSLQRRPVDGNIWFTTDDDKISRINIATRIVNLNISVPSSSTFGNWDGGSVYDPVTHSMFAAADGTGYDYLKVYLERVVSNPIPVSGIIEDICGQVGVTEVEASELDSTTLHGFAINGRMTARAALQMLMDAYFFDGVESDGFLKFPLRGGDSIVSISDDDLASHPADGTRPQKLITTRVQELELPRAIEISYIDHNANYAVGVQRETRLIAQTVDTLTIRLAIAMSHDEARQIAAIMLSNIWMERTGHVLSVSREYAALEPSDIITVIEDGNTHNLRIINIDSQGGILGINTVNEEASVYSSSVSGVPLPSGDDIVDWPGPTTIALVDVPLLSSHHNKPGMYVAIQGTTAAWTGAVIYKSNDRGVTWIQWTVSSRDAVIGNAATALSNVSDPFVWDDGNSVTIRLFDPEDSLESDDAIDVLNDANHALLGDEVIGWTTVVQNSDGSYTLSGLLRGRKGTEWATADHTIGETFIVLNTSTIHFLPFPVEEINASREYVAISVGMGWGSGLKQEFTCRIRNMMPLAPVHVRSILDDSNNLTISWIRRARYSGDWRDEVGPPLGETSEVYEVDIYNDDGEVVRTIQVGDPLAIYSAADQVTDGLTPGNKLTIIVYQISSVVGRGFGTTAIINDIQIDVDLDGKIATADGEATTFTWVIENQDIP